MMEHLQSTVVDQNGDTIEAYREVDPMMIGVHSEVINKTVEEAFEKGDLNKDEAINIPPLEPAEGRGYGMPKVHKPVPEGKKLPPLRLVVSGNGCNMEQVSHFIDSQ